MKKYIRYYIYGYLNLYYVNVDFSFDPAKESYVQYKLKSVLAYVGINSKVEAIWLAPFLCFLEAIVSSIIVFFRFIYSCIKSIALRKRDYEGLYFFAPLSLATFRVKGILKSIKPIEINTVKIPFIKNEYRENEIDIFSVITLYDVFNCFYASVCTIWKLYKKYRKRDPLFRSVSSYEYLLTCLFVEKVKQNNSFVYYNNYDRWAFLMCNTPNSIFIQHGKLTESLRLIKIGTPSRAYYLNEEQKTIIEHILFKGIVREVGFRPCLEFSYNQILKNNGRMNVLLVCWSNNIDKEWTMCRMLTPLYNLYIKPHPGDKDNPEYLKMRDQLNCIIVPKEGYPKVDVVISYDSTLADEYADVGVKVIRYDMLANLNELTNIINDV